MKIKNKGIVLLFLMTLVAGGNLLMGSQKQFEIATLGGGCFWCVESVFDEVEGVIKAESGYSGGTKVDPTYKEVCTGNTGHAEVVQITFDSDKISFKKLLEMFFHVHDPTTLNRQGNDIGTQYRSVILYHSESQKAMAEEVIKKFNAEKIWKDPIVTQVIPFEKFYKAEAYHQGYYQENQNQPYCRLVITPKYEKFRKIFKDDLKK